MSCPNRSGRKHPQKLGRQILIWRCARETRTKTEPAFADACDTSLKGGVHTEARGNETLLEFEVHDDAPDASRFCMHSLGGRVARPGCERSASRCDSGCNGSPCSIGEDRRSPGGIIGGTQHLL